MNVNLRQNEMMILRIGIARSTTRLTILPRIFWSRNFYLDFNNLREINRLTLPTRVRSKNERYKAKLRRTFRLSGLKSGFESWFYLFLLSWQPSFLSLTAVIRFRTEKWERAGGSGGGGSNHDNLLLYNFDYSKNHYAGLGIVNKPFSFVKMVMLCPFYRIAD